MSGISGGYSWCDRSLTRIGKATIRFSDETFNWRLGHIDAHDRQENELSVEHGWRILGLHPKTGVKFWIITEADRSATTFLLPNEY